jgi:hypothetical protein
MTESKMKELTDKIHARPATVSDIPSEDLDPILVGVGFPPNSAEKMQKSWSARTPLNKRTLRDFAAGAAQEQAEQTEGK